MLESQFSRFAFFWVGFYEFFDFWVGGEIICEMNSPSQWNFNVAWCPRNPALFSTCSFDGHVAVSSLVGGPQQPQTSTKIADSFPGMELYAQPAPSQQVHSIPVDLRKPPKWLKRPSTARFGVRFLFSTSD